jgi:hypothetical protein
MLMPEPLSGGSPFPLRVLLKGPPAYGRRRKALEAIAAKCKIKKDFSSSALCPLRGPGWEVEEEKSSSSL